MSDLKDLSEELSSYIADAELLGRVREAFNEMDRSAEHYDRRSITEVDSEKYLRLKKLIEEE